MTSPSASSSSSIVWRESVSDDEDLSEPVRELDSDVSGLEESSSHAEIRLENSRLRRNSKRARRCSDVSTYGWSLPLWSYCTVSSGELHGEYVACGLAFT